MRHNIQFVISVIGGFTGLFIGEFNGLLYTLIAFIVADYITGVMLAVLQHGISSQIGFRGIFKKVLIFIIVGIGHTIDFYLLKDGNAIRTAVIFFYISNEGISILENATRIGLPVPLMLKNILVQFNKKDDDNIENFSDKSHN